MNELKVHMTGRHWEIIRRTPFAALTEIEAVLQERTLLDSLLQRFDDRSNKFRIGASLVSFRPQDVALILGLRCVGDAVVFHKKKPRSAFESRFLSKAYERNKDSIKKTLEQVVRERGEEENFVKLLMVYLMGTILFPNTSCSVPVWIVDYVDDLPAMGRFAWAQATHKWIMEDVPQAAARVQARCAGNKTNTGYVKGCSVALTTWFYELTGTGKKLHFGKTPRILCYGENSYRKQVSTGTLFSSLEGKEVINLFEFSFCRLTILFCV